MAIVNCPGCGAKMSNQWPSCPTCGSRGDGRKPRRRRRLNFTAHYLASAALTIVGALIYGAQFLGRYVSEDMLTAGMTMIVVGALWYGTVRILALIR